MVHWRGNIPKDGCGEKAKSLDNLRGANIPNFFAVEKDKVAENVEKHGSSIGLTNNLVQEIKNAYNDIGISSEVRNASPEAKNLVGNQRSKRLVSVRASSRGASEYRLNVGSSNLENAVEQVVESFYRENRDFPAIIIQKMVEPDVTGAAVYRYGSSETLVEAVKGNGRPLEEGTTKPAYWIVSNQEILKSWEPSRQTVSKKEMMGSNHTRSKQKVENKILNEEKIVEIVETARRNKKGLKFVVKRNTIYVVGTVESKPEYELKDKNKLILSEGSTGYVNSRKIEDLNQFEEGTATITLRGGFTSTASQKARKSNTHLVYDPEADQETDPRETNPFKTDTTNEENVRENSKEEKQSPDRPVTAVDVVKLNSDSGLKLRPPYSNAKYKIGDGSDEQRKFSSENYVTELEELFNKEGPLVVDLRKMNVENPPEILRQIECDIAGIITDKAKRDEIEVALEKLVVFLAVEEDLNQARMEMARIERRKILRDVQDPEL